MMLEIEPLRDISFVSLVQRRKEIRARLMGPAPRAPPLAAVLRMKLPPPALAPVSAGETRTPDADPVSLVVRRILREVAAFYGAPLADLLSNNRKQTVARPRQIACFLAKKLTSNSLNQIGRHIGARDHTTVLHAVRKVDRQRQVNACLADELSALEARLIARPASDADAAP